MKSLFVAAATLVLASGLPAMGAQQCAIHPKKHLSDAQLSALATVTQAEAEKTAIARIKDKGAISVGSAELEAEHGCLIWSFDLRVAGKSGIQEVQVDAGNGKVLSVKHESASQEASEARQEKAATH
jgi:uncharacterized membrane protein YkoI